MIVILLDEDQSESMRMESLIQTEFIANESGMYDVRNFCFS
jgi:hypothetical protein